MSTDLVSVTNWNLTVDSLKDALNNFKVRPVSQTWKGGKTLTVIELLNSYVTFINNNLGPLYFEDGKIPTNLTDLRTQENFTTNVLKSEKYPLFSDKYTNFINQLSNNVLKSKPRTMYKDKFNSEWKIERMAGGVPENMYGSFIRAARENIDLINLFKNKGLNFINSLYQDASIKTIDPNSELLGILLNDMARLYPIYFLVLLQRQHRRDDNFKRSDFSLANIYEEYLYKTVEMIETGQKSSTPFSYVLYDAWRFRMKFLEMNSVNKDFFRKILTRIYQVTCALGSDLKPLPDENTAEFAIKKGNRANPFIVGMYYFWTTNVQIPAICFSTTYSSPELVRPPNLNTNLMLSAETELKKVIETILSEKSVKEKPVKYGPNGMEKEKESSTE